MKINQTFLRQLPNIVKELGAKKIITPILRDLAAHQKRLELAGFTADLKLGETVLPDSKLGPRARFNSFGKYIIHRDRPKEECHRMHYWTYKQWHGPDQVEVEESKVITYYRYARTLVPPPSLHLTIAQSSSGEKIVAGPSVKVGNEQALINSINLVLEIGKECELVDETGEVLLRSPEKRLNWQVLPPGVLPWERMKPVLESAVARQRAGNHRHIWPRLELIESFRPDFHAVGRAGYTGYAVFGFSKLGLFVCESTQPDNATYIFDENWETFSQLTKAEVIAGSLAIERIVHLTGWVDAISRLLSPKSRS